MDVVNVTVWNNAKQNGYCSTYHQGYGLLSAVNKKKKSSNQASRTQFYMKMYVFMQPSSGFNSTRML